MKTLCGLRVRENTSSSSVAPFFLALVEQSLELFEEYMRRTQDERLSPLQRVLAGGDAYLRFHLEHPGLFHFVGGGFPPDADGPDDQDAAARIGDRVGALLSAFADNVDAAIAAGEVVPLDSARLTRFLWGAWNGVIALREQPAGLRPSEDEVVATLELGRWMLREAVAGPALRGPDGTVGDRVALPYVSGDAPPTDPAG